MRWKDISVYKFQQIDSINNKPIDQVDKTLFAACVLFGYTEFELDNLPLQKVAKFIDKIEKAFSSPPNPFASRMVGKYLIEYRPDKLTFGQYVELSFFFQMPVIQSCHYIVASISRLPFRKNSASDHKNKANYFATRSIEEILGCVNKFRDNFEAFNKEYGSLFGGQNEDGEPVPVDKFTRRYGWTYSASCVAEYEKITLDQAYALPIRQALNDLVYLKEKSIYEEKLLKDAR
ncbi:MAG: hypothetical protein QM791_04120 [Ferruginibacter sp.]